MWTKCLHCSVCMASDLQALRTASSFQEPHHLFNVKLLFARMKNNYLKIIPCRQGRCGAAMCGNTITVKAKRWSNTLWTLFLPPALRHLAIEPCWGTMLPSGHKQHYVMSLFMAFYHVSSNVTFKALKSQWDMTACLWLTTNVPSASLSFQLWEAWVKNSLLRAELLSLVIPSGPIYKERQNDAKESNNEYNWCPESFVLKTQTMQQILYFSINDSISQNLKRFQKYKKNWASTLLHTTETHLTQIFCQLEMLSIVCSLH